MIKSRKAQFVDTPVLPRNVDQPGSQQPKVPEHIHDLAATLVDGEAVIKQKLLEKPEGMQDGFSAPWVSKSDSDAIVRKWARALIASAPARTELDFAEYMLRNLDDLIVRLGGQSGLPPA